MAATMGFSVASREEVGVMVKKLDGERRVMMRADG
jgi:hypothetical protein